MVSPEAPPPPAPEPNSSPRISFSGDLLDDANFICITPHDKEKDKDKEKTRTGEFEFLSNNVTKMLSADELFFEGKLIPFWQKQCSDKIILKPQKVAKEKGELEVKAKEDNRMSWFIDEDPSPRPPKCTVLWKELLRLKKQRASSLSPSSSTSSSSSVDDKKAKKKGLERTRSTTGIKIRPVVNVPICTQTLRTNSLPPLFSGRRGMLDR